MMKRAKGVILAEIVEATGWPKHAVRGFVSVLGCKGGEKIGSSKNAAGERTYKIAKSLGSPANKITPASVRGRRFLAMTPPYSIQSFEISAPGVGNWSAASPQASAPPYMTHCGQVVGTRCPVGRLLSHVVGAGLG